MAKNIKEKRMEKETTFQHDADVSLICQFTDKIQSRSARKIASCLRVLVASLPLPEFQDQLRVLCTFPKGTLPLHRTFRSV